MRHRRHKNQLGRKKEHRVATMSNLAVALFKHGRIQTTLAKAKALRPFAEKVITLARKADLAENAAQKLHFRRLAIARVRDKLVIKDLFDNKAQEFRSRPGGYTRIYKLDKRLGDAAEMALIELIPASDEGYKSSKRKKTSKAKPTTEPTSKKVDQEDEAQEVAVVAQGAEEEVSNEGK